MSTLIVKRPILDNQLNKPVQKVKPIIRQRPNNKCHIKFNKLKNVEVDNKPLIQCKLCETQSQITNQQSIQKIQQLYEKYSKNAPKISFNAPKQNKFDINNNHICQYCDQKEQILRERQSRVTSEFSKPGLIYSIVTYVAILLVLPFYGIIQDYKRKKGETKPGEAKCPEDTKDFTQLYQSFESFFTRNIYSRVRDSFNVPITSVPGDRVDLMHRKYENDNWFIKYEKGENSFKNFLNLASYNYLGFANSDGRCADKAVEACGESGLIIPSSEREIGRHNIHNQLELAVANFLGTESALIFGMGFATNSMNIPSLVDDKSLIISDQCNHASIVTGCKIAGATIRVFRHNDMESLEGVLRKAVLEGNPKRLHRPWSKILIIVEGIYSMEGTIVNLPEVIRLKNKYKAYVFLDEAHSIGAMGETGRGVCEYWGINPRNIDIMMGTFTKSFGAAGGYIGGSSRLIKLLRVKSHGTAYAPNMSPPVAAQALDALNVIGYTKLGKHKVNQLAENAKFFRKALQKEGFTVYGNDDSPVVPILTCEIGKMAEFGRLTKKYCMAVVVVGYPATPVTENRVRFCLSAAHTRKDLEKALEIINLIGDEIGIKYNKVVKKSIRY